MVVSNLKPNLLEYLNLESPRVQNHKNQRALKKQKPASKNKASKLNL